MSIDERHALRQQMLTAWQKAQEQQQLTTLESQIVSCIMQHPEFHETFNDAHAALNRDYRTDNNPFLHLSLHISLEEQIRTNRPAGITDIYKNLCHKNGDPHQIQHQMLDIMANIMWDAQQNNSIPDDKTYITKLQQLMHNMCN